MRVPEEIDVLREEIVWFLDYLGAERGASPHTVAAYENDLLQVAELFRKKGGRRWIHFDSAACSAFFTLLGKRRYTASTVQRKTAALRSFLKFLITRRCGPADGVPESSGVRKAKALPKALSKEQLDNLLLKPDITLPAGLRDRAILELLYGTGLRVTELVSLRLEHYVPSESLLRVHGKREKTRIIPIPAGTHVWLREYLENGRPHLKNVSGSHVFLNLRGKPLSRSGIFRLLRDYANAAGIDADVSPHTLRHTYAVHLVQAGADLRSVQELLGHASVATTEVYTHLDIETVRRKYNEAHPRARNRRAD